jgi:hypothetical protein
MVEAAGEKRGVEGAPIVSMGENAVYLVQILSKGRTVTRGEKAHAALLEIPKAKYDRMGLEGVGITRYQGVREPQKNTCGRNRISKPWHQSRQFFLPVST